MPSPQTLQSLSLACPIDKTALRADDDRFACERGHRYSSNRGIPILLVPGARPTKDWGLDRNEWPEDDWRPSPSRPIHPAVQVVIGATSGYMYKHAIGRLHDYPIPEKGLPRSTGELLLDIGCNWGRWTIAAARKGYRVVGIDPDLGAIFTARRVAEQLGVNARFIVADARYLPFPADCFDRAFSYGVIQHFAKSDARIALEEVGRVLRPGGKAFIQMPNKYGLRSAYHRLRQRFHDDGVFAVRYWSLSELLACFEQQVGPSSITVDCYFGLGIQPSDREIVPRHLRPVIHASEALRRFSRTWPPLVNVADSVYVESLKRLF